MSLSAFAIVECRLYPDRTTVEPVGNRSRVYLAGNDLDQLARYVLSLPYDTEVEAPGALRDRLMDLARAVIERHAPAQT